MNAVGARLWWVYAFQAVRHSILGNTFTFSRLQRICQMRRKYVDQYIQCLKDENVGVGGDKVIAEMDNELPESTILVFR